MGEELYHYGVKGMKWGIRRTPAQLGHTTGKKKKRSGSAGEAVKNTAKKAAKAISNKVSATRQKRAEAKAHDAETKKIQENKKKKLSDLTDDELRQRIQRLELEKRYKDLTPKETSKGKAFINAVGKQVIAPAVTNAARQKFEAVLKEQLGLNQKSVDALKGLRDEVERLNLESKKATYQNNIDKQNAEREDRKKERNKTDNSDSQSTTSSSSSGNDTTASSSRQSEPRSTSSQTSTYSNPSTSSGSRYVNDIIEITDYTVEDVPTRSTLAGSDFVRGLLGPGSDDERRYR